MGIPNCSTAPTRPHLFVEEMAERRGINVSTLNHWLAKKPHQLPPAKKLGGRIIFKIKDVEEWEDRIIVPYAPGLRSVHSVAPIKEGGTKRGRPTKATSIAKRLAAVCEGDAT